MGSAQERNVKPMRDSLSCHAKELERFLKGSGNQRFFKNQDIMEADFGGG